MSTQRRQHSAEFKAKVALEAIKGLRPISEIAEQYQIHPVQIQQWKKQLLDVVPSAFAKKRDKAEQEQEELTSQLYQQIGQLKVELDWMKKNLSNCGSDKKSVIEAGHAQISIGRQCELVGLARSTYYYEPRPESAYNLHLMRLIDELHLRLPFYGRPKIHRWLIEHGHPINLKRVERLMKLMRIQAIYPKPKTTIVDAAHKIYPYLLRGVSIERVNHVWSCDITYIPMAQGFLYLFAIIDWYSRYVLAWELSNTLESTFCLAGLEQALSRYGCPEIFNSDQGVQFTSTDFTQVVLDAGARISMDGRGRALDNIFIERVWRTLKYEEVYVKAYGSGMDAYENLRAYIAFYNAERFHQALDYRTPQALYLGY